MRRRIPRRSLPYGRGSDRSRARCRAGPCATIAVRMQVLQAGQYKLIYLELEPETVASIARQAGFETRTRDGQRSIQLDLAARERESPLLLFDAADPANLGWFSRCQSEEHTSTPVT